MREQIIEKALQLFLANGVLQTSMIDIARDLKITKGAIYHYFKNKDELLNATFNLIIMSMESYITPLADERLSIKETFDFLTELMISQTNDYESGQYEFLLFCSRKFPEFKGSLIKSANEFKSVFRNRISNEIDAGNISNSLDIDYIILKISIFFEGTMFINQVYNPIDMSKYVPKLFSEILNELYEK